nr:uncharacterized protein LOC129385577 [Dermacentor andersoni]
MSLSLRFGFPTLQEDVEYGQPLPASTTGWRLTSGSLATLTCRADNRLLPHQSGRCRCRDHRRARKRDYIADIVPSTSGSGHNEESNDGPLPTSSKVIGALALVWCFRTNAKGCGLSCSDSLNNVEK